MPRPRTVLFDLGGVLTVDPWQALLLTPRQGIADRLGLDRDVVLETGNRLWRHYSTTPDDEESYWLDFQSAVGRTIPTELVRAVELVTLRANPAAKQAIDLLEEAQLAWGVVSDNTTFWYRKQLHLLGLEGRVNESLEFVSFRYDRSKKSPEASLFEIAARQVYPPESLVIDDREHNLSRAGEFGFQTARYSIDVNTEEDLLELLRRRLEA